MLHNLLKYGMLAMTDEAESGYAGEQPVRNSQSNWNVLEVGLFPTSDINHSGYLCLKKLILALDLCYTFLKFRFVHFTLVQYNLFQFVCKYLLLYE